MLRRWWSRLRSPEEADDRQVFEEINALEMRARSASRDRQGQLFNRTGDFCFRSGEYARALINYGNAVEAYLDSGHFDAAPAVCRRMIARIPEVVRARSTLAIISLGKGLNQQGVEELDDYVRAAENTAQEELAIRRLRLLGEALERHEVRTAVAERLLGLGDAQGADWLFGLALAERNGLRQPPPADEAERWNRLLDVVRMGPSELLRRNFKAAERAPGTTDSAGRG